MPLSLPERIARDICLRGALAEMKRELGYGHEDCGTDEERMRVCRWLFGKSLTVRDVAEITGFRRFIVEKARKNIKVEKWKPERGHNSAGDLEERIRERAKKEL